MTIEAFLDKWEPSDTSRGVEFALDVESLLVHQLTDLMEQQFEEEAAKIMEEHGA